MRDDVPPDDEVRQPGDEPLEGDHAPADAEEADVTDESTAAEPADEDVRPAADTPPGAPFAAAKASERTSGAGRPAVVPESAARSAASEEELPYIDDRVSKVWVVLIVGIFVAILFYGLLFGKGGALNPRPQPSPTPILTLAPPTASPVASPSVVVSPGPSSTASGTPVPTTSPAASPSTVPSASPTAGAS
jgi:hypothetical protein